LIHATTAIPIVLFAHAVMDRFAAELDVTVPDEPAQMFELFYIGLYEWEGRTSVASVL